MMISVKVKKTSIYIILRIYNSSGDDNVYSLFFTNSIKNTTNNVGFIQNLRQISYKTYIFCIFLTKCVSLRHNRELLKIRTFLEIIQWTTKS